MSEHRVALAASMTVPAHPAFLEVCRNLIATLASQTPMGVDVLEDLRIAADECATQLISHGDGISPLTLQMSIDDQWVRLEFSLPVAAGQLARDDSYAWMVLDAVSDRVHVARDGSLIRVERAWDSSVQVT